MNKRNIKYILVVDIYYVFLLSDLFIIRVIYSFLVIYGDVFFFDLGFIFGKG